MTTHSSRQPTTVTVVHAPACHLCTDAQRALAELAADHPLAVELVAAADPRGAALLADHRPAMFPLVLVDGAFFSAGRLPRTKLRRLLDARAARSAVA
jgi:hypothetical protein